MSLYTSSLQYRDESLGEDESVNHAAGSLTHFLKRDSDKSLLGDESVKRESVHKLFAMPG